MQPFHSVPDCNGSNELMSIMNPLRKYHSHSSDSIEHRFKEWIESEKVLRSCGGAVLEVVERLEVRVVTTVCSKRQVKS